MAKIILNTERLSLREAGLSDSQFIFDLLNTEKWLKYIGDRGIKTLDDAGKYINDKLISSYRTNGFGLYVYGLKESHLPIGICGFIKRDYLDSVDIGFALLPEYERKGYTYEISAAVMKFGRETLGLNKVVAITTEDNVASQQLLKKLGFGLKSYINEPETNEKLLLHSSDVGNA